MPKRYWTDLKRKLESEGSQLYENIVQLKMKSLKDGKFYSTDVLETNGIFRLIESIRIYTKKKLKNQLYLKATV